MSTPLRIPQAGAAMTEGTIIEWVVPDGATIVAGQVVYRLDIELGLVRVEAVHHLTGDHGGTVGDHPLDDRPLRHRRPRLRDPQRGAHPRSERTAPAIDGAVG